MITITNSAKSALNAYATKHGVPAIRFSVDVSGCSGYQYRLDPVGTVDLELFAIDLGDNIKLVLNAKHTFLIEGTVIDYTTVGFNKKFIYTNPNAADWCGCGESFRAKGV